MATLHSEDLEGLVRRHDNDDALNFLRTQCEKKDEGRFTRYVEELVLGGLERAQTVLRSIVQNGTGMTLLHLSCLYGCPKIASTILRVVLGTDDENAPECSDNAKSTFLNARCFSGETAIYKAANSGNFGCVLELSYRWRMLSMHSTDKSSQNILQVCKAKASQMKSSHSNYILCRLLVEAIVVAREVDKMVKAINAPASPSARSDMSLQQTALRKPTYEQRYDKVKLLLQSIREIMHNLKECRDMTIQDMSRGALARSTRLLCRAIEIAAPVDGLFDVCRLLLEAGLSSDRLATVADRMWGKCNHSSSSRAAQQSPATAAGSSSTEVSSRMSDTQQRVYNCAYLIQLAKQAEHDTIIRFLSDICGYAVDTELPTSSQSSCQACFQEKKQLFAKHRRDLQVILAAAERCAVRGGQIRTSAYILWMMVYGFGVERFLQWHGLDLTDGQLVELLHFMARKGTTDAHVVTLSGNPNLTTIPRAVFYLRQLQSLDISETNIGTCLPAEIFTVLHLSELRASKCGLAVWPDIPHVNMSLLCVIANENFIKDVPPAFASSELRQLSLRKNRLSEITANILCILTLTSLNVSDNNIHKLPTGLNRLTRLETLHLQKNPLPDHIIECNEDVKKIVQCISRQADRKQNTYVIVGANDEACTQLRDALTAEGINQFPFLHAGTVNECKKFADLFFTDCSHYIVCIDAGLSIGSDEAQGHLNKEIAKYCADISNCMSTLLQRANNKISFAVRVEETPPRVSVQKIKPPDQYKRLARVFVVTQSGQRSDVRGLARALSADPIPWFSVVDALPSIANQLKAKHLPFIMDSNNFKKVVVSLGKAAEAFVQDYPDWLEKLCNYLLISGAGVLLRGVHPVFHSAVCTDLLALLRALRTLMCVAEPGLSDTPAVQDQSSLINSAFSAAGFEFDNDLAECLWSFAEQNNLSFRIKKTIGQDSPTAFLPLMCSDEQPPDIQAISSNQACIQRVCALSAITATSWTRYQACILCLQQEITDTSAGRDNMVIRIWRQGLAFVCRNITVAIIEFEKNPSRRLSLNSHQQLPVAIITVVQALSQRYLGPLVDTLIRVCQHYMPDPNKQLQVKDYVSCPKCMLEPSGTLIYCEEAVGLLNLMLAEETALIRCPHHLDVIASQEHLSDLLLQDFLHWCTSCSKNDLEIQDDSDAEETLKGGYSCIFRNESFKRKPVARKKFSLLDLEAHKAGAVRELRKELSVTLSRAVRRNPLFLHDLHPCMASHADVSLVMPRRGIALSDWLKKNGLTAAQWHHAAVQVSNALLALHSTGYIHCDVKLHNALLCKSAGQCQRHIHCYLVDFGTTSRNPVGGLRKRVGTPGYAATETNFKSCGFEYGCPADVFSFGIMLMEIVAGRALNEEVTHTLNKALGRHIDLLIRDARNNTRGLKHLYSVAHQCIKPEPVERPFTAEIVRSLSLPAAYLQRQSWKISNELHLSSLRATNKPVGFAGYSVVGIARVSHLSTTAQPGLCDQHSLRSLPVPPHDYVEQIFTEGSEKISSFTVTDRGIFFVGKRRAVEVFPELDELHQMKVTTIDVASTPTCMSVWQSFVLVGLENGDVVVIQSLGEKLKDTRYHGTFTCARCCSVKQILPVQNTESKGDVDLWCLVAATHRNVHLMVVQLQLDNSTDAAQPSCTSQAGAANPFKVKAAEVSLRCPVLKQKAEANDSSMSNNELATPLRHLAPSSTSEKLVWGTAGSWLYGWNTSTLQAISKNDITTALRHTDHWREVSKVPNMEEKGQSEILSLCTTNGIVWLGTRLGSICLYSDEVNPRHLTTLDGHCSNVGCLLVVNLPLLEGVGNNVDRSSSTPYVLSTGGHCALECPKHSSSVKSAATQRRQGQPTSVCTAAEFDMALLWEAPSVDEMNDILSSAPSSSV